MAEQDKYCGVCSKFDPMDAREQSGLVADSGRISGLASKAAEKQEDPKTRKRLEAVSLLFGLSEVAGFGRRGCEMGLDMPPSTCPAMATCIHSELFELKSS